MEFRISQLRSVHLGTTVSHCRRRLGGRINTFSGGKTEHLITPKQPDSMYHRKGSISRPQPGGKAISKGINRTHNNEKQKYYPRYQPRTGDNLTKIGSGRRGLDGRWWEFRAGSKFSWSCLPHSIMSAHRPRSGRLPTHSTTCGTANTIDPTNPRSNAATKVPWSARSRGTPHMTPPHFSRSLQVPRDIRLDNLIPLSYAVCTETMVRNPLRDV